MPGLYNITSNTGNIAVTNTTGLYNISSNTAILNSAEQLLALLDNSGNVHFALDPATNSQTVYAFYAGNIGGNGGGSSTLTLYGDVNAYGTIGSPIATVLTATGVTAGTYGNATYVPQVNVDSKGRITSISNIAIPGVTYGNTQVAAYLPTYTGNVGASSVIATGFIIGDGSKLTNLPATNYGNSNVASYLPIYTGNVGASSVIASGYFVGDGSKLTNLPIGPTNYGNSNVAAYMPSYLPTYAGPLAPSLIATNTYLWANGQPVSFGGGYGNAQVASYLASNTDPTITALWANDVLQQSEITAANAAIVSVQANLTAYETYGNATYATITTTNTLQTEITANAALITGLQTQMTSNAAAIANLQTEVTANSALITGLQTQMTSNAALITNLQTEVTANAATLSSFQTYANATYATQSGLNAANTAITAVTTAWTANAASQEGEISGLRSNIIAANAAIVTVQSNLTAYETYGNATYQTISGLDSAIATYLPTYTGYIGGNITIGGNLTVQGNVVTNGYDEVITGLLVANSTTPATSTTTGALQSYGGAGIQGALYAGSVQTNTYNYANGTSIFTGINSAINQVQTNLNAYETYGNATYATQATTNNLQTEITSNAALITGLQTQMTSNAALITGLQSQMTSNAALITNLQTEVTANAATLSALSANVGSFYTYANATYATQATTTNLQNEITAANAAIVTANTAVVSYVNTLNAAMASNVAGANAAIVTANTAMNAYVNAQITGVTTAWTANAASQETEISGLSANITAANTAIATLSANVGTFETLTNATIANIEANVSTIQGELGNVNIYEITSNNSMSSLTLVDYDQTGFQAPFITSYLPGESVTALPNYPLGGGYLMAMTELTNKTVILTSGNGVWTANTSTSTFNNTLVAGGELYIAYQDTTGNVWVGGEVNISSTPYLGLWLSQDNGQTWSFTGHAPGAGYVAAQMTTLYSSGGPILVATCGTNGPSNFWTSSNNGLTWTQSSDSSLPSYQYAVLHLTGYISLLGGNDGIYRSTTGASGWTKVQSTPGSVLRMCNTGTSIIAVCDTPTSGAGYLIWRSTDNGLTWTGTFYWNGAEGIDGFQSLACYNNPAVGSVILAGSDDSAGSPAGTLRSTDDGRTWSFAPGFGEGYQKTFGVIDGNFWGAGVYTSPLPQGLTYNALNNTIQANLYAYGNVTANSVYTSTGIYWSGNGQPWVTPTTYGNSQVAAYLASGTDTTINSIETAITANAALITGLQTQMTSNAALITGLQTQMTSNAALITGLQSQMTSNASLITGLQSQVTSNATTLTSTTNELHSFETYANATYQTQSGLSSAISTFLPTYNGYIGGNITVGGNLTVQGNIVTNGYEEVVTGLLIANSTTPATSTTTGALQSYGGAGIQGALWAGSVNTNTYNYANGVNVITGINNSLGTLQTEITANAALITGLQSQMTSNAALITNLQTEVTANAALITGLQSQMTSNSALITGLQTQMTSNAALITGLQSQMTSNSALITGLQTQMTANAVTLTATTNELHSFETYANATYALQSNVVNQIVAGTNITISPTGGTGVVTINASGGGGGGLSWQSVKTSNFTATAGDAYAVNTTSGNITVTMPSSPSAGAIVNLTDYNGNWATSGVNVYAPSVNIDGQSGNVTLNNNRESVAFVYIDSTQGWIPYSGFNTSTPYAPPSSYSASYLIVAGGGGGTGGGGTAIGGGGGAGGLLTGTTSLIQGTTYSFVVGGGGALGNGSQGTNGSNSTGLSLTTIGGGAGGYGNSGTAGSGGSGGGQGVTTGAGSGGSGTSGQGYAGGTGQVNSSGGGGGAGAAGSNAPSSNSGGNGGIGSSSSITGTATYYAGGGGGGAYTGGGGTPGTGGSGGGATGANQSAATNATANTGGGGGGGTYYNTNEAASNGGSGVVIISVPTASYSGTTTGSPSVTTSGSNTILTYTSSGSYTA
jgi:predicted  nucleic acid-binding Zn-ribbon protein